MKKNLLKLFIIPLFIAAVYFVLQALFLLNQFGVFSIVDEVALDFQKTNQQDVHLLKDQKATGTFRAKEDNLGILLIWLVKFGEGSDRIAFRIKKDGETKWYHESTFRGDQIQNNQYFPLGFPPIANSKNNKYVFELESLAGEYNGVGVIKDKPAALMHKYSLGNLKNYKTLFSFTFKKSLYILENINYWQITAVFVLSFFLLFLMRKFMKKKKTTWLHIVRFLIVLKKEPKKIFRTIIYGIKSNYLSLEKKIINFSKKAIHWLTATSLYIRFLNTNTKKRLAIGILLFLLALTYRFSTSLIDQTSLFYFPLGGQGDYDQFIRTATCTVKEFCPEILHQNLLVESTILGIFYEMFGFIGGLKSYLYLMLILSSLVATLPYFLLSRKNWITLGGIVGSLILVTSDFLTSVALSFPPDNGSVFTFSVFFIIYFVTMHIATLRWILIFGLAGTIDGFNKALFLINDLVVFMLFVPAFLLEKAKKIRKFPFTKLNSKLITYSILPLLIFLTIYSAWEYFVYVKWAARYFLGELIETWGSNYLHYTSLDTHSSEANILLTLFYLSVSTIVMVKRLVEYMDFSTILLALIPLGLVYVTFIKREFRLRKILLTFIFSSVIIALLVSVKNNYFSVHKMYPGEYIITNWLNETYIKIFLFLQIIFLFVTNFKFLAIRLSLPIIPYVIMLVILTENSPFPRISTHVVVWSTILFAFLIDFLALNSNKYQLFKQGRVKILSLFFLLLFVLMHTVPKINIMYIQLQSGLSKRITEVKYLKWVNKELPSNAIVLGGGNDDLVTVAEIVRKPVIYSTLYTTAVLIPENRDSGKVTVNPAEFKVIEQLREEENFKKYRHVVLEENIEVWRKRLLGGGDEIIFSTSSANLLSPNNYEMKVYKFNQTLRKGIYELTLKSGKE